MLQYVNQARFIVQPEQFAYMWLCDIRIDQQYGRVFFHSYTQRNIDRIERFAVAR